MRFQVTDADTAAALGSGEVPVLATPRLIAWLEAATVLAAAPSLRPGQTTLGTAIRVDHRRATAVGGSVEITVKSPSADVGGRRLTFEVLAVDGSGQIVAAGEIDRVIVDRDRFIASVAPPTDAVAVEPGTDPDWRTQGVVVIPAQALDTNTPQTLGMNRAAAITHGRVGSRQLWAGTVSIHPGARTGAHHHGELESVIYVIRGRARMRWGAQLEYTDEAGPGGFIYVPPFVPHQEINALDDQPLECVLTRSGQDPIVINLDIDGVADPEHVPWTDPCHP